jgi:hypothetical protein
MPQLLRGLFYEFHAERVISRRGQPIVSVVGFEIGPEIPREEALRQVRGGKDVYTLNKEDASRQASQLYAGRSVEDTQHDQVYYSHFHPGVDGAIRSGGRVLNEAERAQERSPEPTHNLPEHRDFQFECGLQQKWNKSWLDPWKCLVGASVEATGPAAVLCVGRASASRASLLEYGTSPSLLHHLESSVRIPADQ